MRVRKVLEQVDNSPIGMLLLYGDLHVYEKRVYIYIYLPPL